MSTTHSDGLQKLINLSREMMSFEMGCTEEDRIVTIFRRLLGPQSSLGKTGRSCGDRHPLLRSLFQDFRIWLLQCLRRVSRCKTLNPGKRHVAMNPNWQGCHVGSRHKTNLVKRCRMAEVAGPYSGKYE